MSDHELTRLRQAVDGCNQRLAALLQERATLVAQIGAHKRRTGQPPLDPARETAMLAALLATCPSGPLDQAALQRILHAVLAEMRPIVLGDPS